jgi:hypothetical protein
MVSYKTEMRPQQVYKRLKNDKKMVYMYCTYLIVGKVIFFNVLSLLCLFLSRLSRTIVTKARCAQKAKSVTRAFIT